MVIFTGHLDKPDTKISALGIGISWLGILAAVVWGGNIGFQTIANRCIGLNEYGMIKRY